MEIGQILGGVSSPPTMPNTGLRMKRVYICSPLKGDKAVNIRRATAHCRYVFDRGFMPIAPHIYFTLFLDDDMEIERKKAMDFGIELLKFCDELWAFGERISDGMSAEIELAMRLGIVVKYVKESSG